MTLRNWVIGYYIVEYEQHGKDKRNMENFALKKLAKRLIEKGTNGFSFTNLHLYRSFYRNYPQIIQTVSELLQTEWFTTT